MSRKCNMTGKSPQFGNTRSKALNANRKKWNVNLQTITIIIDKKPTKIRLSANAIRTLKNKGKI